MALTFMGECIPRGWSLRPNSATGNLALIHPDGTVLPERSAVEIMHLFRRYWRDQKGKANEQHRPANSTPRGPAPAQCSAGDPGGTTAGSSAQSTFQSTTARPAAAKGAGGIGSVSTSIAITLSGPVFGPLWPAVGDRSCYVGGGLPRTPPVVGEIVGHRGWRLQGGNLLISYSAGVRWYPGQPMQDTTAAAGNVIEDYNHAGVWAFKSPYLLGWQLWTDSAIDVLGTIWMWGTVIEHEDGYRSQYATVRSIEWVRAPYDLESLRRLYGDSDAAKRDRM